MNNNRGNNRRRGRGNNRQQGGQQMNRIDSRARGNAPQLLEKYRKLAHDAHLNGDRVQEEYYLQFADHYFRVIADQKQRQEESRQPRRDDRSQDYGDDTGSEDENDGEAPRYHQQDRGQRYQRSNEAPVEQVEAREEADGNDGSIYEPPQNPFVRDNRGARGGLKQRKPRRGDDAGDGNDEAGEESEAAQTASEGFDPATLPPPISAKAEDKPKRRTRAKAKPEAGEEGEEKPKRRRTRKPSASSEDGNGGSALETVD
ncbi:DUF4167 domain-containing protein [Novosphingobium sp. KN65.2]|uniref:DUF4167 domain-containing protein n=1 Tax=Novosphingobium sp. KN65.2 TaxID=1478134 RepID=UPI0009EA1AA6|nr:DUF4167 domain-containing protein [Novosphingobium sp. KN65.2]